MIETNKRVQEGDVLDFTKKQTGCSKIGKAVVKSIRRTRLGSYEVKLKQLEGNKLDFTGFFESHEKLLDLCSSASKDATAAPAHQQAKRTATRVSRSAFYKYHGR